MTNFTRPTLITITAPTCSGKSYLMAALEKSLGFTRIVSTTTRAPRVTEIQGVDYDFISYQKSRELERTGSFAELVEFNGVRYGVTKVEMNRKMGSDKPPMVILEPQGLELYKKMCFENGWDIFTVYVSTVERLRTARLANRTTQQLLQSDYGDEEISLIIKQHTERLLSIVGDERRWSNVTSWDAVVPGDDIVKALAYIEQGIKNRNFRIAAPTAYIHQVV